MTSATLPEEYPGPFDEDGRPLHEAIIAVAFRVFAQRLPEEGLDARALDASAERHLGARVGAMEARRAFPSAKRGFDGATLALKRSELVGTRALLVRPAREEDLAAALRAASSGHAGAGLDGLARRCKTVFVVAAHGDDDAVARVIAEACARAHLGPVLTPKGLLVGPKTLGGARS